MAFSKCPKCDSTYFEVETKQPSKSNYKLMFVQCSSCGCVVGTMDYWNIGTKIIELEKKIDSITHGNSFIRSDLNVVNQNIANLYTLIRTLK